METNILVQYSGGGYDGCIWEWNHFYIDKDGKFEDIYSSGCDGIKTIEGAEKLLAQNRDDTYIYHLDNDDEMLDFAKSNAKPNITGVVAWFNNYNVDDIQPFAICDDCGGKVTEQDDIMLLDWHGCGGIASTADKLVCYECYSMKRCDVCEEYDETTKIYFDADEAICESCKATQEEDEKVEDLKEKVFLAHLIGKPDLFGPECREYWC